MVSKPPRKYSETRPKPKRHHLWWVLVFIVGSLLPPVAVVMMFGVTRDFWINVVLTICGYIPGHAHNYLQNIRDNTGRGRTPAWAVKHGLLPKPKPPTHSWSNRYAERNADNVYDDEAVAAEGEEGMDSLATSRPKKGGIDQARRDRYHGATSSSSSSSAANGRKQNNSRSMDDNYVYDDDAESIGSHSFTRGPSSSSTLRDSNEDDDRSTRKKSSGGGGGIKSFFGGGGSSKKQKNRKKDRFEVEREARGIHGNGNGNAMNGAMGDEEYGDDFEREINGGRSRRSDAAPLAEENERVEGDGLDHRF